MKHILVGEFISESVGPKRIFFSSPWFAHRAFDEPWIWVGPTGWWVVGLTLRSPPTSDGSPRSRRGKRFPSKANSRQPVSYQHVISFFTDSVCFDRLRKKKNQYLRHESTSDFQLWGQELIASWFFHRQTPSELIPSNFTGPKATLPSNFTDQKRKLSFLKEPTWPVSPPAEREREREREEKLGYIEINSNSLVVSRKLRVFLQLQMSYMQVSFTVFDG